MNIAYNWLTQYVNISCDLKTLCDKLTTAGIEVEAVESKCTVPAGVVAAKILERKPHPDSDHMSICQVDSGNGVVQVVCGAPNCDAGKVVPLATIGTMFQSEEGSFKIKKSKLRGVESCGMMCSAAELGVGSDDSGLLELDLATPLGKSIQDLYPGDAAIEVEVTPNRPDWLSHFGIARDIACLLHGEAKLPAIPESIACENPETFTQLVTVKASDLCSHYGARILRNVKVAESPEWLKNRLTSIGLRPINNIVDVTNFVMMELGQPLHAFDLAKLEGSRIVVRRAAEGEHLVTLDGKDLALGNRHLVICDAKKPMALAGVMGGEYSGVSESTTDILIESAVFQSSNIRATSRELGISSDASYRYERGVDFDMCEIAGRRAAALILELAGGYAATESVVVETAAPAKPVISCRFDRIRSLIGITISNDEIVDIFRRLALEVRDITPDACTVIAPLFRLDLSREADLAEEVARINGLGAIPAIAVKATVVDTIRNDSYFRVQELREQLLRFGLFECMHYSMVKEKAALMDCRFTPDDLIRISNPLNLDMAVMRPSLLGEMLETVERNIARRNLNLRLFEIGRAFCKNQDKFPEERLGISLILTGLKYPERFSAELEETYDVFDLKGIVESLLVARRAKDYKFEVIEDARFAHHRGLQLLLDGKPAGCLGELNKSYTASWRTTFPVFMAEIEVKPLMEMSTKDIFYQEISNFPATTRDIAMVKGNNLSHADVVNFIRNAHLKNLENVELFDLFADEKALGANRESTAYRLTFRAKDRTLTDDEVNKNLNKLREKLTRELGVELR